MTTPVIVITLIVVLLALLAFLIGKDMNIEQIVVINKSSKEVFDYLKFEKNQDNFSVWNMADPEMRKDYTGTDGQVGFVYSWDSCTNKNVGAGEQEIVKIEEGKRIDYEIRFSRPMQNVAKAAFKVTSVAKDKTEVMWGFYSTMAYPMNIGKPIFQKMLGKDLQKGLLNLKALLEK